MTFWHAKRVTPALHHTCPEAVPKGTQCGASLVTGGNGFLGKYILSQVEGYVACKLTERGADVFIADKDRYDLRHLEDIRRALSDSRPQLVIHLAARVGGIGANREHPAEFFGACPELAEGTS
jgi:UDP-glucose 4-epimerase